MTKVGIITIVPSKPNYGNRLQNYATQIVLQRMGTNPVTYFFEPVGFTEKQRKRAKLHELTHFKLCKNKGKWKYYIPRRANFEAFNQKFIHMKRIKRVQDIHSDEMDYFVTGSDQVFNPEFYSNHFMRKSMYLLQFAKPEQKICMSPSFGISQIPEEWKGFFKEQLQTFGEMTVREDAGREIIKELTGKESLVTIDPTLMLNKEDWRVISEKPKGINTHKPYILTYFLGGQSEETKAQLDQLSKQYNLQVLNMLDKENWRLYSAHPGQFVYLVDHCSLMMTDSFHACVFSFLFDKPFLVFERNGTVNMMSRIQTLLSLLHLERKFVGSHLDNDVFEHDYQTGNETLELEREKLSDYLRRMMHLDVEDVK